MTSRFLLVGLLLATCSLLALASDPSPLQDFCVADLNSNGITIANAVFGSNPDISDDILAKAFQVDKKVIDEIQSNF
ncbi:putative germin-like protein 2-1 [Tanacetum coccineum]